MNFHDKEVKLTYRLVDFDPRVRWKQRHSLQINKNLSKHQRDAFDLALISWLVDNDIPEDDYFSFPANSVIYLKTISLVSMVKLVFDGFNEFDK